MLNFLKNKDESDIKIDLSQEDDTKSEKLLRIMHSVDIRQPIDFVLEETGIKNLQTLKTLCTRLRKQGISLSCKWGNLIRKA